VKRGHLVILLVEDDDNDIYLVRRATGSGGAGHSVHAVHDGMEAIDYLTGVGVFADRNRFPLPNVVMTDLKMPRMGGFDFLHWLRTNPQYSVIPTIIYSSSHLERDVREAYSRGANSYIAKPSGMAQMLEILGTIYNYWSHCECPALGSKQKPNGTAAGDASA